MNNYHHPAGGSDDSLDRGQNDGYLSPDSFTNGNGSPSPGSAANGSRSPSPGSFREHRGGGFDAPGPLPGRPAPVPVGGASDSETVRLLWELVETQKKSLRAARLSLGLCLVTLAAVIFAVPIALRTVQRVNAAMSTMTSMAQAVEAVAEDAGKAASRIGNALDGGGLSDALSHLTEGLSGESLADSVRNFQEGMVTFRAAMDKLNSIDFDALNQAVQDLSGMAAPFRQFSGLFG
ncbi:MAG: hypothetical protein IJT94_08460 [Oscillibacter sp.]|nr:hypothetical protein [Oscillibacter sp.]